MPTRRHVLKSAAAAALFPALPVLADMPPAAATWPIINTDPGTETA